MKFLKQTNYTEYVIAKLSKYVKSACRAPQIPFYGVVFFVSCLEI